MDSYITGHRLQALASLTITTQCQFDTDVEGRRNLNIKAIILRGDSDRRHFYPPSPDEIETIKSAEPSSIFVYTHMIPSFFSVVYPHLTTRFVLITHNSDDGIFRDYIQYLNLPKVKLWLGMNAMITHPKLVSIPIGIANAQWPHGNLGVLDSVVCKKIEKTRLCYFNFQIGTNHSARSEARYGVKLNIPWNDSKDFPAYLEELASHKYSICPIGNGADTHRFWESIYLDVIPVVIRSTFSEKFESLPVLYVNSWEDVTEELLLSEYDKIRSGGSKKIANLSYYADILSKI